MPEAEPEPDPQEARIHDLHRLAGSGGTIGGSEVVLSAEHRGPRSLAGLACILGPAHGARSRRPGETSRSDAAIPNGGCSGSRVPVARRHSVRAAIDPVDLVVD